VVSSVKPLTVEPKGAGCLSRLRDDLHTSYEGNVEDSFNRYRKHIR
jgi:hypothetical protein